VTSPFPDASFSVVRLARITEYYHSITKQKLYVLKIKKVILVKRSVKKGVLGKPS
jgi:hypothetical protein